MNTDKISLRVAIEFSTPQEMKKYLKEHPDSDKSKHTVKKDKGKKPGKLKGLVDKVKTTVKKTVKKRKIRDEFTNNINDRLQEKGITYKSNGKIVDFSVTGQNLQYDIDDGEEGKSGNVNLDNPEKNDKFLIEALKAKKLWSDIMSTSQKLKEASIVERMEYKFALGQIAAASGDKKKYMEYFDGKLKKWNVSSPSQLDNDKKKKFFEEVDAGWSADEEADCAGPKVGKMMSRRSR